MKGQTALEYLMMYGWALIIVLVIISILYTTIFKPEFYVVEKCDTAPDIGCVPGRMKLIVRDDGTDLVFDLVNSMGYDIRLLNVSFYPERMTNNVYLIKCDQQQRVCRSCDTRCLSRIDGYEMKNGDTMRFGVLMYDVKADIDKVYKIKFVINYNITDTGTIHKTAGVINLRATRE